MREREREWERERESERGREREREIRLHFYRLSIESTVDAFHEMLWDRPNRSINTSEDLRKCSSIHDIQYTARTVYNTSTSASTSTSTSAPKLVWVPFF